VRLDVVVVVRRADLRRAGLGCVVLVSLDVVVVRGGYSPADAGVVMLVTLDVRGLLRPLLLLHRTASLSGDAALAHKTVAVAQIFHAGFKNAMRNAILRA